MTPRTAACSCGRLTATVAGEPLRVSVCHCLACQRRTGSVFGVQARFRSADVRVDGPSRTFLRVGDGGSCARFRFCPTCGATVYFTIEGADDRVVIPVGAFADPAFPAPSLSLYEERMHAWVGLPDRIDHMR